MATLFTKLNHGWNAEPNCPAPLVSMIGKDLTLEFLLNPFQFPDFANAEKGILLFSNCWRYRLGTTNHEGWYRGQCRFSQIAPSWGELYEVNGDLLLSKLSLKWITTDEQSPLSRHFLFYLRDETFECDATDWKFSVKWETPSN